MGDLFKQVILNIVVGILKMVDFVFSLFKIASGIEKVRIGESQKGVNILTGFITNRKILNIFFSIVILSLCIGLIFTIISSLKNMIKVKKETSKIAGQYLITIVGMFVVFITIYGVIVLSGEILTSLNLAFQSSNSKSIGNSIIETLGKTQARDIKVYESYFQNDLNGNLGGIYKKSFVDDFMGELIRDSFFNYSFENNGLINPSSFQPLILLIAACLIGFTTVVSLIQLIIRIFDVIVLLLVMPLPLCAYPLDDGSKFREWRKIIIGKIFLAFGTVMAVNAYLLVISLINEIKFDSNLSLASQAIDQNFILDLFKVFMVVGGSFTISSGQMLFARIMGVSSDEANQSKMNFRNAFGGLSSAYGIAKGAGKILAGGKSKEDKMGEAIARHIGGGTSKATANGGRFKGISNESLSGSFKKGGALGVGANIAIRTGQKLFGKGYGTKIAQNTKNRLNNTKAGKKFKQIHKRIDKEGIIGASVKNGKNIMNGIKNGINSGFNTQGWED